MELPGLVESILRDPVTLEPLDRESALSASGKFLELRSGGLSRKNEQEIAHFRRTFRARPPEAKLYSNRIGVLPAPVTEPETLVLDIGCGPYDCLSAMPGTHIFLDDIMDLYVDEIGARLVGSLVCARTELMPFADDSIELLYSVNMLDHVDDMPATIAEMHRVLHPDGQILCQSYFNSHPLYETEPGVFDRTFFDEYVLPLFDVEHVQTYAPGDPMINRGYTMDTIGLVLKKRTDAAVDTKPRDRYLDADYMGPQSHISVAIGRLKHDDADGARGHIEALAAEPFYDLQYGLLQANLAIIEGDPATANEMLKDLRSHDRVKVNPHARLAIKTLQNRRIRSTNRKQRARLHDLKERVAELEQNGVNSSGGPAIRTALRRLGRGVKRLARL